MYRKLAIISMLIMLSFLGRGQNVDVYDLLTEPSLSRPLTLHQGFLQLYGGYTQLNGNNYFNETGTRLPFTEAVKSIIENNYRFEVSYGIIEHLEFFCGLSYRNRFESLPTFEIDNRPGISIENRTYHQKGISNLDLLLKYRIPEILSGFDIFVYGGILTPVSSQHPKAPTHSIELSDPLDPQAPYSLDYEFNPAAGSPALYYSAGMKLRYVQDHLGLTVNMNVQNPIAEVETYSWVIRRYGADFEYLQLWYYTKPQGSVYGGANIEAQLFPWFLVNAGYQYFRETPGWTEISGPAISLEQASEGFIQAGFEIQVSTHLRLLQQVSIPIHGKNTYSEFGVSLGICYNIVPLKNLYY